MQGFILNGTEMKNIVLYLGLIGLCCLAGCRGNDKPVPNNENPAPDNENVQKTAIDAFIDSTNHYRYISLEKAFHYSYKALNAINKADTSQLGKIYLNHASLFYLCSRYDSANKYLAQYDDLKISNPYALYSTKHIDEKTFHEYTYLKMLRDIQQIEIDTRTGNFWEIAKLSADTTLRTLGRHNPLYDHADSSKNKEKYKDFYNSEKWRHAKMLYHIKLATFNFYLDLPDNKETFMENCFVALSQLSRVSDSVTQNSVKKIDESVLYHYKYALANTYLALAKAISADKTNSVNNFLENFFKERDTLDFQDNKEKDFLRKYNSDSIKNPQKIAERYYHKADSIYSNTLKELQSREKTDSNYIYWTANFLQDLAGFKMTLEKNKKEKDSLKKEFTIHLINTLSLFTINTEKYLRESDDLFERWGGNQHIDYFQSAGSKCFLAEYYYNNKYKDKAISYLKTAEMLLDSATRHEAFSFQIKYLCYELYNNIDSAKYGREWRQIKFQNKHNFAKNRMGIDVALEKQIILLENVRLEQEKLESEKVNVQLEQKSVSTRNWFIGGIAIIAVIVIAYLLSQSQTRKRKYDKEYAAKDDIINKIEDCANKALKEKEDFQNALKELSETLLNVFESEYCVIGKITEGKITEDYPCAYEKYTDEDEQQKQEKLLNEERKLYIVDTKSSLYKALEDNEDNKKIRFFDEKEIIKQNPNYETYKEMFVSKKLSNTAIILLQDNGKNIGYIQLVNTKKSKKDINVFSSILQSVQIIINNEANREELKATEQKLEKEKRFVEDSKFIQAIIEKRNDVDKLLDDIMKHLSEQFNAAIISFRTPVLTNDLTDDKKEREPLFYLRRCYVSTDISKEKQTSKKEEQVEKIKEWYYKERIIIEKEELGGYEKLKCFNKRNIILTPAKGKEYYSQFELDQIVKKQTIVIPILKDDIDLEECVRTGEKPICKEGEHPECVYCFENLYGVFILRLFKNQNEITEQEETHIPEEIEQRLDYLSEQISLIFNSIVNKYENNALHKFSQALEVQQFLKIKDFDERFVEIIKDSTRAKGCSIYRYNAYFKEIRLSATTSETVLYEGKKETMTEKIMKKWKYSLSDEKSKSIVVRVFKNQKLTYLDKLSSGMHQDDFVELLEDGKTSIKDESIFLIPIIKKSEDKKDDCLGVVVLFGKEKDELSISDKSYWEQDKNLIEFIVEMLTRISEADNERLTFLGRLVHELRNPLGDTITINQYLKRLYDKKRADFDQETALDILQKNIDNSFLFNYIISDIEHIYSSSAKDIVYDIKPQQEPNKILSDVVALFSDTPIKNSILQMPPLNLDKDRIKQVFYNILKNAEKYSNQDKPIEIDYIPPEKNDTKQHEIKFINYGIGILEGDKERIFELYKRGENVLQVGQSGSGIGLYIVKEIMKAHGGDCIIRKLNKPTEISLIFPKNE